MNAPHWPLLPVSAACSGGPPTFFRARCSPGSLLPDTEVISAPPSSSHTFAFQLVAKLCFDARPGRLPQYEIQTRSDELNIIL